MKPCWEDEARSIELHWSLPRSLEEYEEELHKIYTAFFYSISCPWTETDERLLYVGMTYKQNVWKRMNQHGLDKCRKKYPRKSKNLIISVASIEDKKGNITKNLVNDIEALLIYSCWNEHMVNERSINGYTGRTSKQIRIVNHGYTLLPREVFWGASKTSG